MKDRNEKFQFSLFLSLIRALFPRWDFFDRIAYQFELEVRNPSSPTWERISFLQNPKAWGLVLNSNVNEALLQVNLLEHFARDLQELQLKNPQVHSGDIQALTSYSLLLSLLRVKLKGWEVGGTLQFKVVAVNPAEEIDLYLSDWLPWESA